MSNRNLCPTGPPLGTYKGVVVYVEDEPTMRELVKRTGGNPDEWEKAVVMAVFERCHVSQSVWEILKAEIPEELS